MQNSTIPFDPFTDFLARSMTRLTRLEESFQECIKGVTHCITEVCEKTDIDFLFDCCGHRLGVKKFQNGKKHKYVFLLGVYQAEDKVSYRTFEECLAWVEGASVLSIKDYFFLYKNLPCILNHLSGTIELKLVNDPPLRF